MPRFLGACFCFLLFGSGQSFQLFQNARLSPMRLATAPRQASKSNLPNTFGRLLDITTDNQKTPEKLSVAELFLEHLNSGRIDVAVELLDDSVSFEDSIFPGPFAGKEETERVLRLMDDYKAHSFIVDGVSIDGTGSKIGVLFHTLGKHNAFGKKGAALFDLSEESKIEKIFLIKESTKSGEANLKVLNSASRVIDLYGGRRNTEMKTVAATESDSTVDIPWYFATNSSPQQVQTLPEQYFQAWNKRDMSKACALFSESCRYDDTAFPAPFEGRGALEKHLHICSDCFPPTFSFVVDDVVNGGEELLLRWHIENDGEPMPFSRGLSFYRVENGKISEGVDFVEPAVFKTGGIDLVVRSILTKLVGDPIRMVPLITWVAYVYVVFFSSWFFGEPATALEQRTWEEVRDLSLNFFLVSPILNLPFAPVVHPMMEGVFNLLLSWAALFVGFLSDDRREKPNLLPMLPMVAVMQFLTSAFLLPYLVTRSDEKAEQVLQEDLPPAAQLVETRLLAPILAFVGTGSILWGIFARENIYGGLGERWTTFVELLSIDRVGSSFLVDLAIFAIFQGWFVADDSKRRGMEADSPIVLVAKYIPFFGMAAYLTFRKQIPCGR